MGKPLRRHRTLQPLSREHHHGLLLCWKIRNGLRRGVAVERIKKYCDVFFESQLLPHFELEETHLFPLLGTNHKLFKKGIKQHQQLELLFRKSASGEILIKIADLLEEHIRFEERQIFGEVQKIATPGELEKLSEVHSEYEPNCEVIENWDDNFWESNLAN